jgi:non-specific serine/threonine protein kinase
LTLTGPGGSGKTRLALVVAERLLRKAAFEHGVWFVELAGLDTATILPQLVASTIGVPEAPSQPLIQTLAGFLKNKKLVVILDNCEHLLAATSELVRTLLAECPGVHFLATSREPLSLSDETIWLVPSMALPAADISLQLEQLAQSEAIQLFVARANAALPGFTLTESNAAAVEQICRRLDGIPLAIELAAARVKLLQVEQIANRLGDSMQLLAHGSRVAAPRHQTMRAALDWSYALLSPRERLLFQRLAVFAGEFTLDAAEFVCADEKNLPASDVLDGLADLLDKSLVLIAKRPSSAETRYRLLEPIRQYALQVLREAGAEAAARSRHLDYFVRLAEEAEPKLKSHEQLRWLERLDSEHDNLRSALSWSTRGEGHAQAGLRLATALHLFWQRRGHWSDGRRW